MQSDWFFKPAWPNGGNTSWQSIWAFVFFLLVIGITTWKFEDFCRDLRCSNVSQKQSQDEFAPTAVPNKKTPLLQNSTFSDAEPRKPKKFPHWSPYWSFLLFWSILWAVLGVVAKRRLIKHKLDMGIISE